MKTGTNSKVLVLLASFNGGRWIEEQIRSILDQVGVEVHIIVSDDRSTDDTRARAERFVPDGRVTVLSEGPRRGSAARNFLSLIDAITAADFDFVAFADQDDFWYRDKLMRAVAALTTTGCNGYSSASLAVWEDGAQRTLSQSSAQRAFDFLFEGAGQGCTFVLAAGFYTRLRDFLAAHPTLTEGVHYHDWLTYALARVWKVGWCFDRRPSLRYQQHAGNDTGARASLAGLSKRLALIANGWYRQQVSLICCLCMAAAPADTALGNLHSLLMAPASWTRRLKLAYLCLLHSRRRISDRAVLVLAALSGRI